MILYTLDSQCFGLRADYSEKAYHRNIAIFGLHSYARGSVITATDLKEMPRR